MNNQEIIIQPTCFTPDTEGFHPFTISISSGDIISNPQQLYFHKCLNTEYQEYSSAHQDKSDVIRQSEENLQTVYFYNDEVDYDVIDPTLQINSKRTDRVSEQEAELRSDTPTTLYFIEEES